MSSTQSPKSPERSASPTGSPDQPTTDVENQPTTDVENLQESISSESPDWSSSGSDGSDGSDGFIKSDQIPQDIVDLSSKTERHHEACATLLCELRRSMWYVTLPSSRMIWRDQVRQEYEQLAARWKKARDRLSTGLAPRVAKVLTRMCQLDRRTCLSLAHQLRSLPTGAFLRRRRVEKGILKLLLKAKAYREVERAIGPEQALDVFSRGRSPEDESGLERFTIKGARVTIVECEACDTDNIAIPHVNTCPQTIDDVVKEATTQIPSVEKSRSILAKLKEGEKKRREYEPTIPTSTFRLTPKDKATDNGNKFLDALRLMERRRSNRKKLDILQTRLRKTILEQSPALKLADARRRSAMVLYKDLISSVQDGDVRIPVRHEDGKLIGYLRQPWERTRNSPQEFRVGGRKNASNPWDPSPLRKEVRMSHTPSPEAPGGNADEAPETHNGNKSGGK